jgi:hypothetical protein
MAGSIRFRHRFEDDSPFVIGVEPLDDIDVDGKLAMEFETLEQAVKFNAMLEQAIRDYRALGAMREVHPKPAPCVQYTGSPSGQFGGTTISGDPAAPADPPGSTWRTRKPLC